MCHAVKTTRPSSTHPRLHTTSPHPIFSQINMHTHTHKHAHIQTHTHTHTHSHRFLTNRESVPFRTFRTLVPSSEPACISTSFERNHCNEGCVINRSKQ